MKYLKQSIRFFSETNPHLYMRARDLGVLADRCVRPTDKLILLFKTTWGKNHNLEEKITTWRKKSQPEEEKITTWRKKSQPEEEKNHNLEEKITTWRGKNYNLEGKNHKLKRKKITTWREKYHNLEEIMTFGGNCTSGPCWEFFGENVVCFFSQI